jgi:hypothetical protein
MGKERNGGASGEPPVDPKIVGFSDKGREGPSSDSPPVDSRVARRRQDPIGRRLRKFYEEVVEENIPDEFLSILEDVDDRQGKSAVGVAGGELSETGANGSSSQADR